MTEPMTLLVVDKDRALLEQFKLRYKDYINLLTTSCIPEIKQMVTDNSIDIFLVDGSMAGDSSTPLSIDILKKLRNEYPEKLLLVMEQGNFGITSEKIKSFGADGLLRKPFTIDELIESIEICLKKRNANPIAN
jgi:DNA-binding NtrC family response regulator